MGARVMMRLVVGALVATLFSPLGARGAAAVRLPDVEHPKVLVKGTIGRHGGTLVTGELSDPRTFNSIVSQETSSTIPKK